MNKYNKRKKIKTKKIKIDFDGLDTLMKNLQIADYTRTRANTDMFEAQKELWEGIKKHCKKEIKQLGTDNLSLNADTKELSIKE